jgi:glutathione S-transferase
MSQTIRLHRFALSGHCHRVELFLSLLGLPFESIDVDLPRGQHKQPAFLAKNPLGQVPVLEDEGLTLADSNAILVYLASRYGAQRGWLPDEPARLGAVQRWLSIAAGPLVMGAAAARMVKVFGAKLDLAHAQAAADQLLQVMDAQLSQAPFLTGEQATLADVALYSYTAVAPKGGVSLAEHTAVQGWLARVEGLPRFVPMPRSKQVS